MVAELCGIISGEVTLVPTGLYRVRWTLYRVRWTLYRLDYIECGDPSVDLVMSGAEVPTPTDYTG